MIVYRVTSIVYPATWILSDYVRHVIHAGRLPGEEFGRFHGAFSKDGAGIGGVPEFDDLILADEHYRMVADDGPAAHRGDTNLLGIPLLMTVVTA